MNNKLTYVAFLRGINVGGNKKVKMEELKKSLEELGLTGVKTILNSGNIIFNAKTTDPEFLVKEIEKKLENKFGLHVDVVLRSGEEIMSLISLDPFKEVLLTANTRLYVTFLKEKISPGQKPEYKKADKSFEILRIKNGEICSVINLLPDKKTTEFMENLEKEFGKNITTRNWNTILRIAKQIYSS